MRRKRLTRTAAALLSIAMLSACGAQDAGSASAETAAPRTVFAMDTVMELTPYGAAAEAAGALAEARIQELEAALSVTQAGSDIYAVNHSGGEATQVSEDTAVLLENALRICRQTDGALDVSIYPVVKAWGFTTGEYQVPDAETIQKLLAGVDYSAVAFQPEARTVALPAGMEIDLGGIAKGYTGDQVMKIFREQGVTSAIISLGGNVQVLGAKPDGSAWRVAVQNPQGGGYAGVLEVVDQAVITSGGYERYFEQDGETYWHIIDPATGAPAKNGVVSVTVVGDSGMLCDALSTALFILGTERAAAYWRTYGGFDYVMITEDGEILVTQGLADRFTCSDGWTVTVVEP